MNWPKRLNKKIKAKVNLAGYTSFKIGGPAEFFYAVQNSKDLQQVLAFAKRSKLKVFILGSGSNILVSDSGVKGLVIKLIGKEFKKVAKKGRCIIAGSSIKLSQLVLFAKDQGLSGLEFLCGIPGTLGGALMGNAGAWGKSIGSLVKEVLVLDNQGKLKRLDKNKLKFSYRKSNLNNYVITSAKIELSPKSKNSILKEIKRYLFVRRRSQNNRLPNAGCIFKNPKNNFAGRLIESCQLKGESRGGAVISKLHANFILNAKKAKSKDVLSLMHLIRKKVKGKFKINLTPEIKIWK